MTDAENNDKSLEKAKKDNAGKEESSEVIPAEMLKNLPPETRKEVLSIMSMQRIGPMPSPFAHKVTEEHISKILEIAEKDDDLSYKDVQQSRKYTLGYILIFVALFIFLVIFLSSLGEEIFKLGVGALVTYLGGIGTGFGASNYVRRK